MENEEESHVEYELNLLAQSLRRTSVEKWGSGVGNDGEAIALIHSELSEALEAYRDGNPPSEKIRGFSKVEEEMADTVIRVLEFCERRNLNVAGAIMAKAKYNRTRPVRHGGKLF